ncbi:outer membrane protein insertion porin family [Lebetimonas natsushimae]|uniref:Outer membrane protein assembly factor BamA n=1 Tax=Lebetimonas natsushimae TaxID=1936991 RepID=A0A292YE81_9BACT|nr:outer membrane protein assembly factor BamA [Lebetimonas natsushimae]GAX87656.1 outer membrane protein insertion porin family [Lebetimonas natsushimae]
MKKIITFIPFILLANINQIEYKGLIHISPITANTIITIHKGDELDLKKIDESIKNLYKTGYFKTIKADYTNNKLTFICQEKPIISKLEFENLSEDLKKLLKEQNIMPKKGEIYKKEIFEKLKDFIEQYYLAKKYFNTYINIEKNYITPTKLAIKVIIVKGKKINIKDVNFYGVKQIDKSDLIDLIENQPKTFWSFLPFFNAGELNVFKLPEDRNNIQNFYFNLGYMDSKVQMPLAKVNMDNYSSTIDYKIYEGKRYIIKKISIDYPKNIKVKLPKLELKPDKYFNISAMREDLNNIKHAFQNEGYAYVNVYPNIKKEGNYATIIYKVIPGEIVYIRNVTISGNNKTLDRVVRRNIFIAPGDKYSYQNITDSKYALQRTGYLEDVKIEEKKVSNNQIDLNVKVKEGLSGTLKAGISYGSYSKFGVSFSITEKDIFGSGQKLSASADLSATNKTYSISLYNPRVFDSKYSMNTSIFNDEFEGLSYTSKKRGFTLGIGKMLSRNLSANVTYGYTKIKLTNYDETELDYLKPSSTKSYIIGSLGYNSTDNYFFPTLGMKASASIEFAGIGGDERFTKTIGSFKYFYPLKNSTYKTYAILKYRIKAGAIKDNGYLPIDEKFYLGGIGSVRGFSSYSISPKDNNGNYIGGKYEFVTGPEISTPINRKIKLWASAFVDYGAVGEKSLDISRASAGIAINWITPVGPLTLVFAKPIKKEDGDDTRTFDFSIGASF